MKIIISIIFTFLLTNNSFSSENVLNQASLYTVKIRTSIDRPFHEDDKAGLIRGSGFLIDKENGLIITNAHITGRSKSKIKVAFKDYGFETAKQVNSTWGKLDDLLISNCYTESNYLRGGHLEINDLFAVLMGFKLFVTPRPWPGGMREAVEQ